MFGFALPSLLVLGNWLGRALLRAVVAGLRASLINQQKAHQPRGQAVPQRVLRFHTTQRRWVDRQDRLPARSRRSSEVEQCRVKIRRNVRKRKASEVEVERALPPKKPRVSKLREWSFSLPSSMEVENETSPPSRLSMGSIEGAKGRKCSTKVQEGLWTGPAPMNNPSLVIAELGEQNAGEQNAGEKSWDRRKESTVVPSKNLSPLMDPSNCGGRDK
ncbi:unnamed protein product [Linum trigynum]|uniref:Uncharacterized protein n=1 Tax=Linum trigynum TaxID=586398 RepID=A0AAV2FXB8_9ROSI